MYHWRRTDFPNWQRLTTLCIASRYKCIEIEIDVHIEYTMGHKNLYTKGSYFIFRGPEDDRLSINIEPCCMFFIGG